MTENYHLAIDVTSMLIAPANTSEYGQNMGGFPETTIVQAPDVPEFKQVR